MWILGIAGELSTRTRAHVQTLTLLMAVEAF